MITGSVKTMYTWSLKAPSNAVLSAFPCILYQGSLLLPPLFVLLGFPSASLVLRLSVWIQNYHCGATAVILFFPPLLSPPLTEGGQSPVTHQKKARKASGSLFSPLFSPFLGYRRIAHPSVDEGIE